MNYISRRLSHAVAIYFSFNITQCISFCNFGRTAKAWTRAFVTHISYCLLLVLINKLYFIPASCKGNMKLWMLNFNCRNHHKLTHIFLTIQQFCIYPHLFILVSDHFCLLWKPLLIVELTSFLIDVTNTG